MLLDIHKLTKISLYIAKEKKSLTENDCVRLDTQVYSRGNNHPLHIQVRWAAVQTVAVFSERGTDI
jgi:hypothetical protein